MRLGRRRLGFTTEAYGIDEILLGYLVLAGAHGPGSLSGRLVIVIIHLAQPTLLDLIGNLLEMIQDQPIVLLLIAARPARPASRLGYRRTHSARDARAVDRGGCLRVVANVLGTTGMPDGARTRGASRGGEPAFRGAADLDARRLGPAPPRGRRLGGCRDLTSFRRPPSRRSSRPGSTCWLARSGRSSSRVGRRR